MSVNLWVTSTPHLDTYCFEIRPQGSRTERYLCYFSARTGRVIIKHEDALSTLTYDGTCIAEGIRQIYNAHCFCEHMSIHDETGIVPVSLVNMPFGLHNLAMLTLFSKEDIFSSVTSTSI